VPADYFLKLHNELDIEKYKLAKYKELFKLSSFQNMHDADLAYHKVYRKCAESARTKESLLNCLQQEERLIISHPQAFNADVYRNNALKAIKDIIQQLNNGTLDYLFT
jgi:hypothetical protein